MCDSCILTENAEHKYCNESKENLDQILIKIVDKYNEL